MLWWVLLTGTGMLTIIISPLRAAEVELGLTPQEVYPGDLITLIATCSSSEYATFTIALPQSEQLRVISIEPGVVQYQPDRYVQQHVWVLQPKFSGMIQWNELQAIVAYRDREETLQLEPMTVNVQAYPDSASDSGLSNAPAPLPSEPRTLVTTAWKWMLGTMLVVLMVAGFKYYKRKGQA